MLHFCAISLRSSEVRIWVAQSLNNSIDLTYTILHEPPSGLSPV